MASEPKCSEGEPPLLSAHFNSGPPCGKSSLPGRAPGPPGVNHQKHPAPTHARLHGCRGPPSASGFRPRRPDACGLWSAMGRVLLPRRQSVLWSPPARLSGRHTHHPHPSGAAGSSPHAAHVPLPAAGGEVAGIRGRTQAERPQGSRESSGFGAPRPDVKRPQPRPARPAPEQERVGQADALGSGRL